MSAIFINYRRADTEDPANRLYADLVKMFGEDSLFMDTRAGIPWGDDWDEALKKGLENCEVLVALIGPHWTTCERPPGRRALDAPDDWVRTEIATALRGRKKVLPVLLGRNQPPSEDELPQELKDLGFRLKQAYPITLTYWEDQTRRLVSALTQNPKLKEAYNLATGERGIRLLSKLIRTDAKVADAVSQSRSVIQKADRGVDEIRLLKNIHDALHEIESRSLFLIRKNGPKETDRNSKIEQPVKVALANARRTFDQCVDDIRELGELNADVQNGNELLENDLPQCMREAAMAFDNVKRTERTVDFLRLIGTLDVLTSAIPVRLNDQIEGAVRDLELQQLLDLMNMVKDLLGPTAITDSELKPMVEGITALKDLRNGLTLRSRDHGLLQRLDNTLHLIFSNQYRSGKWEDADPEDLAPNRNGILRLRERFTEPFSPVFKKRRQYLEDLAVGVEQAFERKDLAVDILEKLDNYANEVGNVFRQVDGEFKEFCAVLREKTRPLKAILQQTGPGPQNA